MQLLELRADVRGAQRGEELLRQQPARRGHVRRLQEGTRRVQLVRKEGRDVSSQFGRRDETCPVSTGGRKGGGGGGAARGRGRSHRAHRLQLSLLDVAHKERHARRAEACGGGGGAPR